MAKQRSDTGALVKVGDLPALKEIAEKTQQQQIEHVFDGIVRPEDIGYTQPVFVRCFLPTRHSVKNKDRWQTDCGRVSLVIRAGELAKPAKPNEFKKCLVPAGPKARFIVAYVNDYIQRHDTDTVNMGDSLREAMERLNIPVCGSNGDALKSEVENFAAAEITIAGWFQDEVLQEGGRVAPRLRFWLEHNPRQRAIWQPEMTVSADYKNAVRRGDRLAPFLWPAMVDLQHDIRAMDLRLAFKRKFPSVRGGKDKVGMFTANNLYSQKVVMTWNCIDKLVL